MVCSIASGVLAAASGLFYSYWSVLQLVEWTVLSASGMLATASGLFYS